MLNSYTQIIVDEFRKHDGFSERTQAWLEAAESQGLTAADREDYIAKSMEASCLLSMMPVRAPNFAHEILIKAFGQIDWRAAARLLYLVDPEMN